MTSLPHRSRPLLHSLVLLLPVVMPLLLLAPPAQAAPASEAEMNLYTRIAAVNVCLARSAGVEFDKAVGIAGETIAQVILGQHDGAIVQVGPKPLSLEELRQGSINSAVIGAVEVCPKQVPADVVKRVQEALKNQPDAKTPDAKTPDVKTPDVKSPDAKTPDVKTPDVKSPDAKTPANSTGKGK